MSRPRSHLDQPRHRARRRGPATALATLVLLGGVAFVGVRVAAGVSATGASAVGPPDALTSDDTAAGDPGAGSADGTPAPAAGSPGAAGAGAAGRSATVGPPEVIPSSFPTSGPGTWRYAGDEGPVLGTAGGVQRFRVAIESNVTSVDLAGFATKIDQTLGDPRSWIAGRTFRLQRVPGAALSDFTIYLATRSTSAQLCAVGGTDTDSYTSCRTDGEVILNLDRWYLSVPDYTRAKVPLDAYRTYMINHESGHQFGHGHELCPGKGRPAPVMEQQTLGLHGCLANPWPYLDGRRYAGPPGHY
jgi:hypothetical protein